jgi:hypothetical protein
MENDKNLISLKEASKISGYSADYIGQLIRSGKIAGKQVYTNISWMTTAEAIVAYKKRDSENSNKKLTFQDRFFIKSRKFNMELDAIRIFFKTFKGALPVMIILVSTIFLFSIYISYVFSKGNPYNQSKETGNNIEKENTF